MKEGPWYTLHRKDVPFSILDRFSVGGVISRTLLHFIQFLSQSSSCGTSALSSSTSLNQYKIAWKLAERNDRISCYTRPFRVFSSNKNWGNYINKRFVASKSWKMLCFDVDEQPLLTVESRFRSLLHKEAIKESKYRFKPNTVHHFAPQSVRHVHPSRAWLYYLLPVQHWASCVFWS